MSSQVAAPEGYDNYHRLRSMRDEDNDEVCGIAVTFIHFNSSRYICEIWDIRVCCVGCDRHTWRFGVIYESQADLSLLLKYRCVYCYFMIDLIK